MELISRLDPWIYNFPNLYDEKLEVEKYIYELIKDIAELEELPEWRIEFYSHIWKFNHMGISKKGFAYPSYPPEKHYFIYIPFPTNEEISWGVKEKDFAYKPPFDESKLMDRIEGFAFSDFDNLSSYIIENSKIGIAKWLTKGITLKGIKIKAHI